MKGPLNAILSFPQLLQASDNLTDEQREFLDIIEQSGYKMLNIINLSLSLLKMERGSYELTPAPVDILRVLHKVVTELRVARDAKMVSVDFFVSGAPAAENATFLIRGEELLCYSMFSNLLKNAFEHSPVGGRVRIFLDCGATARIRICNQGSVAPEILDRFFEKYVTYGKIGGTGLGTYSARLMARTMTKTLMHWATVGGSKMP